MIPPKKAMSVPTRMGTWMSAIALVRVKRGSTWMMVAPRAFASITHWKPTGWHSAMLEPSMTMTSAFCKSCWYVVALDVEDPSVLDEDLLPAAVRAIGADALHDLVRGLGSRSERFAPVGKRGPVEAGQVACCRLPGDRPAPDHFEEAQGYLPFPA